jgi:DNA polymerase-3 subunit alpha
LELTNYTPLQKEAKGEKIVTQYDMYSLDLNAADGKAVGLLKMDLLGLRNLTILQNCIKLVKQYKNIEINLQKIPLDDKDVYELISSGETTGIFQLESGGMRRLARDLRPNKFSDVSAMVALFRPGPMEWIPTFIEAKENPKKIKYPHKDLKSVLDETYGVAVYQEQCMLIANKLAGYTMVEADKLRMAIGKKKREVMKKEKDKFIKGCIKNGYSQNVAENVFSLIEKFVGYGFNKAHSASYGMIAYQTAYMKAKYTVEFMTALLAAESRATSGPTRDEKIMQAVLECKRMNIRLLPPDINFSQENFSIEKDDNNKDCIRFGLSAIKNVGSAAITVILQSRNESGEFKSFTDFIQRVDLSKVNRKTLESMIKTGTFDRFAKRSVLLTSYSLIVDRVQSHKIKTAGGQVSLFSMDSDLIMKDEFPDMDELGKSELLSFEKQLLGFYLTDHPLHQHLEKLKKYTTTSLSHLINDNKNVIVGGIITNVKKIQTKSNNGDMAFVRLDDLSMSTELVVFPKLFERTRNLWIVDNIILVKGKTNMRDDRLSIIVDDAKLLPID